jgi:hypothetical protein
MSSSSTAVATSSVLFVDHENAVLKWHGAFLSQCTTTNGGDGWGMINGRGSNGLCVKNAGDFYASIPSTGSRASLWLSECFEDNDDPRTSNATAAVCSIPGLGRDASPIAARCLVIIVIMIDKNLPANLASLHCLVFLQH